MKQKYIDLYIDWAKRAAQLSSARRLKVGAIIVKDDTVISYGYNGTPPDWDNNCENQVWMPEGEESKLTPEQLDSLWPYIEVSADGSYVGRYALTTKPEVLHAERNAIDKLARGLGGGQGSSLFVTHGPCLECAKSIYRAGIKEVFYEHTYRSTEGIEFLQKSGVTVTQIKKDA